MLLAVLYRIERRQIFKIWNEISIGAIFEICQHQSLTTNIPELKNKKWIKWQTIVCRKGVSLFGCVSNKKTKNDWRKS